MFSKIAIIGFILVSTNCIAGVVINKTRVVMYDNEQAQQLTLANTNDFPVITQLWVDDGDINATPENTRAPIMAVPAMLKFSQEEHKSIRLINLNHSEKRDQEEMYWLNIYEIPPQPGNDVSSSDNQLMILTIRTQIKVFLRPIKLKMQHDTRFDKQYFSIDNNKLTIKNDSPFFIVYSKVSISDGFNEVEIYPETLSPFSSKSINIVSQDKVLNSKDVKIKFDYIDDDGVINSRHTKLIN
ncbi:molecular chaperone [Shewanella xiamenensis]|uniref:fimbrial biogenesis chaperone n=1 Tax=Shewanella xiamenensis TaxID=332186 RepID=UPI00313CBF17